MTRLKSKKLETPHVVSYILKTTMQSWFEKLAARPQRSILFLSLGLLLAGNWILPLTDRDETRFAEASREMLQRGDFVVPWFNGAWRFDKPILIYWCQSASYRVLGVNDFAARLPSVLFTTTTALLLVRWGRKIADAKTGFLAGAMFIAGLHVAIIGRVATADMAMVFFVTLAVWSGWELTRPENTSRDGSGTGVSPVRTETNRRNARATARFVETQLVGPRAGRFHCFPAGKANAT